ncbi:MAG: PD40 domain-containing protein [Gemmatimonadetes bacterium]|nr:PD40 domain-containing protein [Gemmatimonadota bacterium]
MTRTRSLFRLSTLAGLVWAVAGAPSPAAAQGTDIQRLTLDHYLDMESVSNPRISPDASRIVYTRGWSDRVNDQRKSSLWIMNADGSRNRQLLEGSGAQWSPDGTRILFTTQGEPSGSQIFVRWMDAEGATSQITRLENGPSNARWSPDGKWIAFTSRVDDKAEFAGVKLPSRPKGAQWTGEPKVVERAGYRRDRRGYIDTGWTHLFVVPADGGTPRQLTDGEWNHSGVAWSPDGSEIYFTSYRSEDWARPSNWQESEIYAVTVATRELRQLTNRRGPDRQPVPSPDGRLIAYIAGDQHQDTYRNQRIYVMNLDGSGSRLISGGYDRQSGGLQWAPDGSGLYFNVSREGYRGLHFVSLEGGVTQLTEGKQLLTMSSFSDDGTAVGTIASAHEPGDIYRFSLRNPTDATRLTEVNADVLHGVTLGEVPR